MAGVILICLELQTIDRVETKIREITSLNKPVSMAEHIKRLNTSLGGWIGYSAQAGRHAQHFQEHIRLDAERRRLRMCLWKQWKRVRTRYRELSALGCQKG